MKIKIRKLIPDATIPTQAYPGDAGMDLSSCEDLELQPGGVKSVRTGISIELPGGFEAQIRPKSGLALKKHLTVLNSPGTIDSGYRGEISVILINHGNRSVAIHKGMKIAQMVIARVFSATLEEATELSNTERGEAGFGSGDV